MARDKRDLFGEVPDYDLYVRYLFDFESVVRALHADADEETVAELAQRERTTASMLLEQAGQVLGEKVAPFADDDPEYTIDDDGDVVFPRSTRKPFDALTKLEYAALNVDPELGGQGLSHFILGTFHEMLFRADPAFATVPALRDDIVHFLVERGSEWAVDRYVRPALAEGATNASMQMTEPHAGSDVGAIRARATAVGSRAETEGAALGDLTDVQRRWIDEATAAGETVARITGTKTFITSPPCDAYDHLALVLARDGDRYDETLGSTDGVSMYLVPKWIGEGEERERNAMRCASLEHKPGIVRSPTAEVYHDGDLGIRIGDAGKGLRYMFEVMNPAREGVTRQATAIMQEALLLARAFAGEREQFGVPIREHGQVARMLAEIEAYCQLARAITTDASYVHDMTTAVSRRLAALEGPSPAKKELKALLKRLESKAALLIPAMKGSIPAIAERQASSAVQIEGGRGYTMESRIGSLYRDVRITGIYEGTNEINAGLCLTEVIKGEMPVKSRAKLDWLLEEVEAGAGDLDEEFADGAEVLRDACRRLRASLPAMVEFKNKAMMRDGSVTGGDNELSLLAKAVAETILLTYGCHLLVSQAQTLKRAYLAEETGSGAEAVGGSGGDGDDAAGAEIAADVAEKSPVGAAYRRKADVAAVVVHDLRTQIVAYSNEVEALTPGALGRLARVAAGLR